MNVTHGIAITVHCHRPLQSSTLIHVLSSQAKQGTAVIASRLSCNVFVHPVGTCHSEWLRYAACFWWPCCRLSGFFMFVLERPCPPGLNQYLLLHGEMPAEAPLYDARPPAHTSTLGCVTAGQLFGWEFIISFILVSTVYACAIGAPNFGESACSIES